MDAYPELVILNGRLKMLLWLLLAILLYYVQVFLPAIFKFLALGMGAYLGSRDNEPTLSGIPARLERATRNMQENFPIFATLALALMMFGMGEANNAILGAQLFVFGRLLYVPLYAFGVPLIRSLAVAASWVGMILMVVPLLTLI